jgi:O-antigen/teichoic acid export membrane protein
MQIFNGLRRRLGGTRKVHVANISWLSVEKIIRMCVAVVVGAAVARYLGPDRFGLINYVTSYVAIFNSIAALGIDTVVVRELVRHTDKKKRILGTAFVLKLGGAAIAVLTGLIWGIALSHDSTTTPLVVIAFVGTIIQTFNVIDLFFQSEVRAKYLAQISIGQLAFYSTARLLLIHFNAPLIWFVVMGVFDIAFVAGGLLVLYRVLGHHPTHWCFDKGTAGMLLHESWPLMVSGISVAIYMRIDQVFIKKMLDNASLGYYNAALRLSEAFYFIPMAVSTAIYPALIKAKEQCRETYHVALQHFYDCMTIIALGVILFFSIGAKPIIYGLFGTAYAPSVSILMIHAWASLFVFLGVASSQWFVIEGLQRQAMYRTIIGAVVSVLSNLCLIPHFGLIAVPLSTIISYGCSVYLSLIFNRRLSENFMLMSRSLLIPATIRRLFRVATHL